MLINGNGEDIGNSDLGFAPLLALAAPIAKTVAVSVGTKVLGAVANKLTSKPKPPPCTFFQKLGKVFGSKPNCS